MSPFRDRLGRRTLLAAAAALAVGTGTGCAGGPPAGQRPPSGGEPPADGGSVAAGQVAIYPSSERTPAPELAGELLDGATLDTSILSGAVVVVNFWASWCAPCRAEAGELNATFAATEALGVRFLGVNVRDGRDQARAFVEGRETYPSLFDPPGRIALGFADVSPNTIPTTVIVDRRGLVAMVLRKIVTQAELEPLIRRVAEE